jgi:hypothetical protein
MRQLLIVPLFFILLSISLQATVNSDSLKADAVYNYIHYNYKCDKNITSFTYESEVKILSSRSLNRLHGESFIEYNPLYQTLNIEKSRTTMVDGAVVESPPNAFNEVLPRGAHNALQYHFLREMVVTHTGLELGADVEFGYGIETKKELLPGITGKVVFGDRSPVNSMTVQIDLEDGSELTSFLANNASGMVKETSFERGKSYTWEAVGIPMVEQEESQPEFDEFVPTLYFSTMNKDVVLHHLLQNEDSLYILPEEAISYVRKVRELETNPIKRATMLREYVEKNVGHGNIDLSLVGWQPSPASETWQNHTGTQLYRAVLLAALLKEANIEAVPVLVSDSQQALESIALLSQYNKAMVMCRGTLREGEIFFVDPNHSQHSFIPEGLFNHVYFTLSKDAEALRYGEGEIPKITYSFELQFVIDAEGYVSGEGELWLNGKAAPFLEENTLVKGSEAALSDAGYTVTKTDPEGIFLMDSRVAKIEYETKEPVTYYADNLYRVKLPSDPGPLNSVEYLLEEDNRTTPYQLNDMNEGEYQYSITIPTTLRWLGKPESVAINNEVGELSIEVIDNQTFIAIVRKFTLHSAYVQPELAKQLNELLKVWKDKKYTEIFFEKR